jgi:glycine cleavage system H protein
MHFTDTHEWIRLDGDFGIVGITQHARAELGEIVYIQLPKVGQKLSRIKEAAILESTKAAADIYSPVSGEVIEVNDEALASINQEPETSGWLFKVKLFHPKELDCLMDRAAYSELLGR